METARFLVIVVVMIHDLGALDLLAVTHGAASSSRLGPLVPRGGSGRRKPLSYAGPNGSKPTTRVASSTFHVMRVKTTAL